jgi:methylglyoxal synthase
MEDDVYKGHGDKDLEAMLAEEKISVFVFML